MARWRIGGRQAGSPRVGGAFSEDIGTTQMVFGDHHIHRPQLVGRANYSLFSIEHLSIGDEVD